MLTRPASDDTDRRDRVLREEAKQLAAQLKAAASGNRDAATRAHLIESACDARRGAEGADGPPGGVSWRGRTGGGARMTVRREQHELRLSPLDNRALANLCGPLDANLRQIEAALDVAIAHRGGDFTVTGTAVQQRALSPRCSVSTPGPRSRCRSTTSSSA